MDMDEDLFRGKLLRLTAAREEDAPTLARWSEDPGYMRSLDTDYARPRPERELGPEAYRQAAGPNSIEFRLRTLQDDRLIGFVALHTIEWNNRAASLAIGIGEAAYRGKGYGSEALHLILRYAFDELNLERVGLDVIANNRSAVLAYERVGFRHEGAMRRAVLRDGQAYDRLIMGILREEWSR
jgi:RimJ/RimL family protein N-acetyltransferase